MVAIVLDVEGEGAWLELAGMKNVREWIRDKPIKIAGLEAGTKSRAPSVAIRFDLADGTSVVAETTLKLFLTAADALKARFGDPR